MKTLGSYCFEGTGSSPNQYTGQQQQQTSVTLTLAL